MRNAARQTSSVGAQARSVNPRAGTRSKSAEGYPPSEPRSTLRNPSDGVGRPSCRRATRRPEPPHRRASRFDRSAVDAVPVLHHPERTCDVGDGAPERDRLLARARSARPRLVRTSKNSSIRARSSPRSEASDTFRARGEALERLDRGCDVPVLVADSRAFGIPEISSRSDCEYPALIRVARSRLSERAFVGHASPPIADVARRGIYPHAEPDRNAASGTWRWRCGGNLAMIPDSAVRPT